MRTITFGGQRYALLESKEDLTGWFKAPQEGVLPLILKGYEGKVASVNESDRTLVQVISSSRKDRDGDIITTEGWDFKAWKKNPVILWAHDYTGLPIARGLNARVDGKEVVSQARYADVSDGNPFADQVFRMKAAGFLQAASVGFIPSRTPVLMPATDPDGWDGFKYVGQELLEWSDVPVPSNADALTRAIAKGVADPNILAKMGWDVSRPHTDLDRTKISRPWREASSLSVSERIQAAAEAGDLEAVATFAEAVTATVASQQEVIEGLRKDLAAAMPAWRTFPMTLTTTSANTSTTTTLDPTPNVSSEAPAEEAEVHADIESVQAEAPSEVRARRKEEIRAELRRLLREERRELD